VGHEGVRGGRNDDDVCKDGSGVLGHYERLKEVREEGG